MKHVVSDYASAISMWVRFTPKNTYLIKNDTLLCYLRRIRRSYRGRVLCQYMDEYYHESGLSCDEVQYVCDILGDCSELSGLTPHLPPTNQFELAHDFCSTRLIRFLCNGDIVHWRAAFGLIYQSCPSDEQIYDADNRIYGLLRDALCDKKLEDVVVTLQGGDARRALKIMQQIFEIAEGLSYLHDSGVAHGALRGSNVLIDDEYHVKLADFGLSELIRAYETNAVASFLDNPLPRWMPPEIYAFGSEEDLEDLPEGPTFAGDIYSFASVCVEVRDETMASHVDISHVSH
ncbi:hypothetical protein EIP86_003563 [Pleurotus ostreatoroseus]|nr:hypothetical protein EIP86_003563 [Pleurotus ostreatoroseus]